MSKEEKYKTLLPQVESLCAGEDDMIAKMANVCALLHQEFGFWWTGFYRVENGERRVESGERRVENGERRVENGATQDGSPLSTLILGPFQGPLACMHIGYGKGVCGTAWKERRTVVVPDVEEFPGHIACSSESRSEIVVPVFRADEVVAVLDIDSRELGTFDEVDARWLERVGGFIA